VYDSFFTTVPNAHDPNLGDIDTINVESLLDTISGRGQREHFEIKDFNKRGHPLPRPELNIEWLTLEERQHRQHARQQFGPLPPVPPPVVTNKEGAQRRRGSDSDIVVLDDDDIDNDISNIRPPNSDSDSDSDTGYDPDDDDVNDNDNNDNDDDNNNIDDNPPPLLLRQSGRKQRQNRHRYGDKGGIRTGMAGSIAYNNKKIRQRAANAVYLLTVNHVID
jgi:hypothetical protein